MAVEEPERLTSVRRVWYAMSWWRVSWAVRQ